MQRTLITTLLFIPLVSISIAENTVIITAPNRLQQARTELLPHIGTTVYLIDQRMIDNMSLGENTPFNGGAQRTFFVGLSSGF